MEYMENEKRLIDNKYTTHKRSCYTCNWEARIINSDKRGKIGFKGADLFT